jgi:7-carboxy-7-deazaguanine synthase
MKINQIFSSINGEVANCHQGSLCTFIRLQNCNLNCKLCDTTYAQNLDGGIEMTVDEVAKEAASFKNTNITITGGEPLLQYNEVIKLSKLLYNSGFNISIETNGTFPMYSYKEINWVADWKGPSSGMREKMNFANYRHLRETDIIKFVIENRIDFEDAMEVIKELENMGIHCKIAFSPSFGYIPPQILIEWMKEEKLLAERGAIFSYQIHKLLKLKER